MQVMWISKYHWHLILPIFFFFNQTAFPYGVLSYLNLMSGVKEEQQVEQIKEILWAEVQIFIYYKEMFS